MNDYPTALLSMLTTSKHFKRILGFVDEFWCSSLHPHSMEES